MHIKPGGDQPATLSMHWINRTGEDSEADEPGLRGTDLAVE